MVEGYSPNLADYISGDHMSVLRRDLLKLGRADAIAHDEIEAVIFTMLLSALEPSEVNSFFHPFLLHGE